MHNVDRKRPSSKALRGDKLDLCTRIRHDLALPCPQKSQQDNSYCSEKGCPLLQRVIIIYVKS